MGVEYYDVLLCFGMNNTSLQILGILLFLCGFVSKKMSISPRVRDRPRARSSGSLPTNVWVVGRYQYLIGQWGRGAHSELGCSFQLFHMWSTMGRCFHSRHARFMFPQLSAVFVPVATIVALEIGTLPRLSINVWCISPTASAGRW